MTTLTLLDRLQAHHQSMWSNLAATIMQKYVANIFHVELASF